MSILTLTTDWGQRDHYLGSFKGSLLVLMSSIQIIDITHDVEKFNTMQAAFLVQNTFRKFPPGTIHYIGISGNENCSINKPYVIIRSCGQYLIGQDNGIFTLILGENEREIIRLPITVDDDYQTLNRCILHSIKGLTEGKFEELGERDTTIQESYFAQPSVDSKTIRGAIVYIDDFGNVIVNISKELYESEKRNRAFVIQLRTAEYNVFRISTSYEDADVGEMIAMFNEDGYLEISLNKGSAKQLLGLKFMDQIRIEFDDSKTG